MIEAPDFFSFSTAAMTGHPSGVIPIFACSTSSDAGCGSVAITPDAVFLGEESGVVRLDVADIRSWHSSGTGPLFTLTVECDDAHETYLLARYRAATVTAMTATIGPEYELLRAA